MSNKITRRSALKVLGGFASAAALAACAAPVAPAPEAGEEAPAAAMGSMVVAPAFNMRSEPPIAFGGMFVTISMEKII